MDDSRAFSSYSVDDVEAAKTFYRGTLGLSVNEQPQGLGIELRGGGSVFLYPKDDHRPATFTVLNFRVDDIDTAVDELVAKGVTMERYDGFGQDERGIAGGDPRIAWFTDRPETCCRFCRCDPVASDDYHFVTEWRVAGTIAEVKDVLGDAGSLTRWWPAVYLDLTEVDAGADGVGRTVDLHTKGWLPYTLRWKLRITEPLTDAGFALRAEGDLEGTGVWTFRQDGPEVVITYDWRVHATKPLLRRLGWLLKPAFSANHVWAMRRGEESLRLELRRRRDPGAAVPAPPPPTFAWVSRRARTSP